jgi:ribosome biogenesis protein SSF1/2
VQDVSQLLEGNDGYGAGGGYSDSEAEDDETTKVELSERYVGSGNGQSQQSAMKLVELGPRVGLELFKVERGMCEGDVLYHKFEAKTAGEAAALKSKADGARALKEERRRVQEENVKRKRAEAEAVAAAQEAEGGGGGKKPRRGLEAWAKNKKETFVESDSEEQEEEQQEEDEEEDDLGEGDYYSDSDADA